MTEVKSSSRYLICGSRDFTDYKKMEFYLSGIPKPDVLICGMCRGADMLGHAWAKQNKISILEFPANWTKYGRAAGPIRNQQMCDEGKPTLILAFPSDPDNIGPGTGGMMKIGKKANIPTYYAGMKDGKEAWICA